jgi:hypothetical protein
MWFGKSIMALVAVCGFRRYLGTGKSLSFVGRHTALRRILMLFEPSLLNKYFLTGRKIG